MAAKILEVEALGVERIGDGSTEHGAILTLVQRPRHKAAGPTPSAARSYHYAAGPRSLGRRSATGHRSVTGVDVNCILISGGLSLHVHGQVPSDRHWLTLLPGGTATIQAMAPTHVR